MSKTCATCGHYSNGSGNCDYWEKLRMPSDSCSHHTGGGYDPREGGGHYSYENCHNCVHYDNGYCDEQDRHVSPDSTCPAFED